jgi:hypothetical protein
VAVERVGRADDVAKIFNDHRVHPACLPATKLTDATSNEETIFSSMFTDQGTTG